MNRLPFVLPDFTRRQWVSPQAREVWGPRLRAIGSAWSEIERHSVVRGIRHAHLTSLAPDRMPEEAAWAARKGLVVIPLGIVARSQEYSASSRTPEAGEAWDYRAVYLRPSASEEWVEAWREGDNETMGQLLGYPSCCRRFFSQYWQAEQRIDTTWAMSGDGDIPTLNFHDVDPHNQILGRWAGYRAVPHLPCSWTCEPTREFGRALLELGRDLGYAREMDWLLEALSWPYEWSALHGIAEVRSPILRITTRTDATPGTLTVRIHSDQYPAEGARGTRHPYRTWREERRQLVQLGAAKPRTGSPAANGFTSEVAMRAAHSVLIEAAAPKVGSVESVCDLGAGDGTLLTTLGEALGAERLIGVEIDQERARQAVPPAEVRHGDIGRVETWAERYDLVVLMPGRLEEMEADRRAEVARALSERTGTALLYAYGDWLDRAGGLQELVSRAIPGARPVGPIVERAGAAAALYSLS